MPTARTAASAWSSGPRRRPRAGQATPPVRPRRAGSRPGGAGRGGALVEGRVVRAPRGGRPGRVGGHLDGPAEAFGAAEQRLVAGRDGGRLAGAAGDGDG